MLDLIIYNVLRFTVWIAGAVVALYVLLGMQGCGTQTDKQYNCIVKGDRCERVDADEQPVVVGPAGERGDIGPVGERGESGSDGVDGIDGESCTVTPAVNGALIECSGSTVLVLNGTDGADGQDAPPTAYTVTEVIDPCGNHPSKVDEVLLQLANGDIIASFSDNVSGLNTRFAILGPGTYGTTDGTSCTFTVSNTGDVTW